ncbi:hypothetical protein BGZ97_011874 [Linnemannia gamsii]|uniref:FAD-binding domain-containing protein n=1 Tax=Linnemannia gamsii TaxID=64522 RepID=A0A9P6UMA8_9FUNG|nr:hypothetical protein BGZ97_011874 [Linnemannia gamsii]
MWTVTPDKFPEGPKDRFNKASMADKPTVLIVGAGLGGLMLGTLLEKANIPYYIFERAPSVEAFAKQFTHTTLYREGKGKIFTTDYTPVQEFTGYKQYIISRPVLYDLILQKVPRHKLLFKKRVLVVSERKDKVRIQTGDNYIYEGDILVGADGAYSAVRQRLYEALKKEGKLPKSDQKDLPFRCTSLYTMYTTAQRSICYTVQHQLDAKSSKAAEEQRFRNNENSEWGPGAAQAMCDETRDFPLPIPGGKIWTLGDLYDRTPQERISKVMLEEKVFKTWYSGRTVLMGDACHKLHPSGGHGAVMAMHDAMALANLIYALPSNTSKSIQQAFAEYKAERMPHVMDSYKSCKVLAKSSETDLGGNMALFFSKNIPQFVWNVLWKSMVKNRPLAGFLPSIPSKGTIPSVVSASEQKARTIFEWRGTNVYAL